LLNLILTRHGHALAGEVVLGGQLDVPLSDQGRREAQALAGRLSGVRLDRIVSSPMLRALETAQAVALGRPVEVDERLREFDYGAWEGLTAEQIGQHDPELRRSWEADPASVPTPGGESGNDVAGRVGSFLADLLAAERRQMEADGRPAPSLRKAHSAISEAPSDESDRRVLVAAHGSLNRILLCVALDVPVRDFRRRFVQDRANVTVLYYEAADGPEGAQLVLCNDIEHLRAPGETPWR